MHCVKIRFDGFKRLSTATCNTDTYLLAFVGPNEAGKSSLLDGLVWLTDPNTHELAPRDRTRGRDLDDKHVVVEGTYELNDDDKALLDDLGLIETPDRFLVERRKDGSKGSDAQPIPRRDRLPFDNATRLLERAERRLAKAIQTADDVEDPDEDSDEPAPPRPKEWLAAIRDQLAKPDATEWGPNAGTDGLLE